MRLTSLLLACALMGMPLTAPAQAPSAAIEAVIADQIADFQRDDFAEAFEHASPGIQGKFGGPERFGMMVRQGYPMIWRPSHWEWRGLERRDRGWVQTVLFVDRQGRSFEADYVMEQVDGVWRIDGVLMRRLPGVAS